MELRGRAVSKQRAARGQREDALREPAGPRQRSHASQFASAPVTPDCGVRVPGSNLEGARAASGSAGKAERASSSRSSLRTSLCWVAPLISSRG